MDDAGAGNRGGLNEDDFAKKWKLDTTLNTSNMVRPLTSEVTVTPCSGVPLVISLW